jgi:hypothetical protein
LPTFNSGSLWYATLKPVLLIALIIIVYRCRKDKQATGSVINLGRVIDTLSIANIDGSSIESQVLDIFQEPGRISDAEIEI